MVGNLIGAGNLRQGILIRHDDSVFCSVTDPFILIWIDLDSHYWYFGGRAKTTEIQLD